MFIDKKCRQQLVYLYNRTTPNTFQKTLIAGLLESIAPLFILQRYYNTYSDWLIKQLRSIVKTVRTTYKSNLAQKRRAKATQGEALVVRKLLEQPSTPAEYTTHVQQRDNSLTVQVAIREAARSVVDMPASLLRSQVTSRISAPGSPSSTPLPAILEGIKRAAQVLKDIQRLISTPITHSTSTINSQDIAAPNAQNTAVLDSQDTAGLNS